LRVVAKADSRLLVRHFHLTAAAAARVTAFLELARCDDGQLGATSVIQAAPNLSFFESHISDCASPSPGDCVSCADAPVGKTKVVLNSKQAAEPGAGRRLPLGPRTRPKDGLGTGKSTENVGRRRAASGAPGLGRRAGAQRPGNPGGAGVVVAIPTRRSRSLRKRVVLPILAGAWYCNSAPFLEFYKTVTGLRRIHERSEMSISGVGGCNVGGRFLVCRGSPPEGG
jgi:hypothetical protein